MRCLALTTALAAVAHAGAVAQSSPQPAVVPVFSSNYGSNASEHRRFGRELGRAFAAMISERHATDWEMNAYLMPFVATTAGKAVYEEFLAVNQAKYPLYMEELRGLSEGTCSAPDDKEAELCVPFANVFVLNSREGISEWAPDTRSKAAVARSGSRIDHCSDYM